MHLDLIRYKFTDIATHGLLFLDSQFFCYTLEDKWRGEDAEKVPGRTCIPMALKYEVKLRRYETDLTRRYRNRFDWFKYHLHVTPVKGFQHIYFHLGNDVDNTDGCILVGDTVSYNKIGYSERAFKRFYERVYDAASLGILTLTVKQYFTWDIVLPTI